MTDNKITVTAIKGLQLFKQNNPVAWNSMEVENAFLEGYKTALKDIESEKMRKAAMKSNKFNIQDFIDKYKTRGSYEFMSGVYYDSEAKKAVVTNGNYMLLQDCEIPENYADKIVNKDGLFIDGRFPNWRKVVPENKDIEKQLDGDSIKQAIIDFSSKYNLSLAACEKWCEKNTIGGPYEVIKDKLYLTPKMAKYIVKFVTTQKTLSFYAYKEDRLTFDGKLYQRKYECTWVIEGDNATMVFMPCKFPEAEEEIA